MKEKYEVYHREYTGPLEGLLESSRKQDVVLSQVDISELIADFHRSLKSEPDRSVNVLSEYLLIFSELIRIKTRDLLPDENHEPEDKSEEFEEGEGREFYELMSKQLKNQADARSQLYESTPDSLPQEVRQGETRYREVTLYELIEAFRNIMVTTREESTPDIELTNEYETSERMEFILGRVNENAPVRFDNLLSSTPSREEVIVTFLAILQLVKQDDLRLIQAVSGGSIQVVSPGDITEG